MKNKKSLNVVDEIIVNEDSSITGWLCALIEIDLNLNNEKRERCPAPSGDCPRGFSKMFQCESLRSN